MSNTLPECLTKFDNCTYAALIARPKKFYEVIVSRPAYGTRISECEMAFWSAVAPSRYFLKADALESYIRDGFKVCILRELDELPHEQ